MKNAKRIAVALAVLTCLAGGYLAVAHFSGGAYPTFGLPLGGERGDLRRLVLAFWEDIQFKDFKKAATYHDPAIQDAVDIPTLLERLFVMKPESLDITDTEILFVDIDSSGNRARIKSHVKFVALLDGSAHDQEVMLFFRRENAQSPWYMDLESSLRNDEGDPNKKK